MSNDSGTKDWGSVWRDQPEEKLPVNLKEYIDRRTRELHSTTRSEILMSIAAAVFFGAMIAWRFVSVHDRMPDAAWMAVIAVLLWVGISLYWFRDRLRRGGAPSKDALAATGLEYYRKELEQRRNHLRNAWLWHGPLLLACAILIAMIAGKAFPGVDRLRNALPLVVLLALWTGFGIRQRQRQASELRREIEQVDGLGSSQ